MSRLGDWQQRVICQHACVCVCVCLCCVRDSITAIQAKSLVAKRPLADWAAVEKATSAAAAAKLQKNGFALAK